MIIVQQLVKSAVPPSQTVMNVILMELNVSNAQMINTFPKTENALQNLADSGIVKENALSAMNSRMCNYSLKIFNVFRHAQVLIQKLLIQLVVLFASKGKWKMVKNALPVRTLTALNVLQIQTLINSAFNVLKGSLVDLTARSLE